MAETIEAAAAGAKGLKSSPLKEIRETLNPMRDDIRNRFNALSGTGPNVAKTVRTVVSAKSAGIAMGSPKAPYSAGREFGAKQRERAVIRRRPSSGQTYIAKGVPYWLPSIFGLWTGNQFEIGESGGRLTLGEVSGNAFYPGIGAGAQNIYTALEKTAADYIALFPGTTGNTKAGKAAATEVGKLSRFLKSGGL